MRSIPRFHKESLLRYELVLPGSHQLKEVAAEVWSEYENDVKLLQLCKNINLEAGKHQLLEAITKHCD
jgi:hypothetical protein